MRRTIEVRRGDVMHYTWRESKAADGLNLRFFGLRTSIGLRSCLQDGVGKDCRLCDPTFGTAATAPARPTESQRRLERLSESNRRIGLDGRQITPASRFKAPEYDTRCPVMWLPLAQLSGVHQRSGRQLAACNAADPSNWRHCV